MENKLYKEIDRLREVNAQLLEACKGAVAALSQNATFPADILAAKTFLKNAIAAAEVK
jgi:hypothetical protein